MADFQGCLRVAAHVALHILADEILQELLKALLAVGAVDDVGGVIVAPGDGAKLTAEVLQQVCRRGHGHHWAFAGSERADTINTICKTAAHSLGWMVLCIGLRKFSVVTYRGWQGACQLDCDQTILYHMHAGS
jgi:hypothetical protein